MKNSCYYNPETRPFGAFYDDLTEEEFQQCQLTIEHLSQLCGKGGPLGKWARLIEYALRCGFESKPFDHANSLAYKNGYLATNYDNRVAAWVDYNTRLWHVLEWNNVKGVVVRKYGIIPFFKKLLKAYQTHHIYEDELEVESITPFITQLFPRADDYEVQVWDTPSRMYDETSISSCMTGEVYVKFYDTAPVKGLVVMLKGKMVARCLLWTLDDGRRIIGTIYDSTGFAVKLINDYCYANNILTCDGWDDDTIKVTAPVSSYGVPYQDNLYNAVRQGNNVILFTDRGTAHKYMKANAGCYGVLDTAHTWGGHRHLREDMVEVVNGPDTFMENVVEFDGKKYDYTLLSNPKLNMLLRYQQLEVLRHPTKYRSAIYAKDLITIDYTLCDVADTIDISGKLYHISDVYYMVDVDANNDLVINPEPIPLKHLPSTFDRAWWEGSSSVVNALLRQAGIRGDTSNIIFDHNNEDVLVKLRNKLAER